MLYEVLFSCPQGLAEHMAEHRHDCRAKNLMETDGKFPPESCMCLFYVLPPRLLLVTVGSQLMQNVENILRSSMLE